jgi:integrase
VAQIRKKQLKNGFSYEVRIHRAKHPTLSKSFRSHAEARAWANEIEGKIDQGHTVSREAQKAMFGEVIDLFSTDYRDPKTNKPIDKRELERIAVLKHDLEGYSVNAIDRKIIANYITKLLDTDVPPPPNRVKIHKLYEGNKTKKYAPSTVRKFFYQLKKVMEWHSHRNNYVLTANLFENQPVPKAWEGARERRLEDGEEERIYESARNGLTNQSASISIIKLALETAMRAQELLLCEWKDIDLEKRVLRIPRQNSKTKQERFVPLSKKAIQILEERNKERSNTQKMLFTEWASSDMLSKQFRRICYRADILNLKFHDLRHEATSRFFEKNKLSDMEIMKITGHSQYSTLKRYVNLRHTTHLADKMD